MKTALIVCPVILLALIAALIWRSKINSQFDEARADEVKNDPWANAEQEIQEQLTNDVVGYLRTIRIDLARDGALTNWTADVTLEFINHHGGVDRTNLPYRCYGPHIWSKDDAKLFAHE